MNKLDDLTIKVDRDIMFTPDLFKRTKLFVEMFLSNKYDVIKIYGSKGKRSDVINLEAAYPVDDYIGITIKARYNLSYNLLSIKEVYYE